MYGDIRTDVIDYATTLAVLSRNAGAWQNSGLRKELPDPLREYLDGLEKHQLKEQLRLMNELKKDYGYEAAVDAMTRALNNGCIHSSDARILAERITGYGINTPPDPGPSLSVYDDAFPEGSQRRRCCMMSAREHAAIDDEISAYCKRLFFTDAISDLCGSAGTPKQIEFLRDALKAEITRRDENRKTRLIKRARFPVYKTFEGYDYHSVKLPPALTKAELEGVDFIEKRQNLVSLWPGRRWKDPHGDRGGRRSLHEGLQGAVLYSDRTRPETGREPGKAAHWNG